MEENYLRPDYSEEEEALYDSSPSEDDDDDDVILEDTDDSDDGEIEKILDNNLNNSNNNMQTSGAFNNNNSGGSFGGSNNQSSPWSNSQPTWANGWSRNSTPWSSGNNNSWGTSNNSPWGTSNNNNNPWGTNNKRELDRKKKIIFCDVLDCLVETYQSNGKPGLIPRGIYDIRLRFEVWDKLGCFSPDRIYAMVPKQFLLSSNGSDSWKIMLEYVICSLSEYLRLPFSCCQILTQTTIGQPKEEMIESILAKGKINRKDAIQIGIESGLSGQNNRDKISAERCRIDYIDLGELMTIYF